MDRQIPKEEQRKVLRKRLLKWGVGASAAIAAIAGISMFVQDGIKRSSLTIGVADRGALETSVAGTGRVVPAFEQIINSPISSRIVEVYSKEGDTVDVGTPLLRLDLESTENEIGRLADERRSKVLETEQTRLNNTTYLADPEMQAKAQHMDVNRLLEKVSQTAN